MIYVDTSAFLALTDSSDQYNGQALSTWRALLENNETLVCNNYVLVESIALIQRRAGLEAVQVLQSQIAPFLEIEWIEREFHDSTVNLLLITNRRKLSFVDLSSFSTMRQMGIQTAFTFDEHFREQGFRVIP
jgi:predicted nucleic acid-binding protein